MDIRFCCAAVLFRSVLLSASSIERPLADVISVILDDMPEMDGSVKLVDDVIFVTDPVVPLVALTNDILLLVAPAVFSSDEALLVSFVEVGGGTIIIGAALT